jgi:phospholipid transport system substrate-binding protein
MGHKSIGTVGVFFAIYLCLPSLALCAGPTQDVRSTVEGLQTIMLDARQLPETKKKLRLAQLKQIVGRRFDFTEMAKRALGPNWERRSQRERGEYVKLFAGVVETSYLDRMETYAGEHTVYVRENRDADYAEVATKALAVKGDDLAINYKLRRARSGDWKVYDLIIDNVSTVNNYRAQFARILNGGSFDQLLDKLREARDRQIQAKKSRPDSTLLSAWLLAQASGNRPR